jgi:type IV pilus assembly protein PilY1
MKTLPSTRFERLRAWFAPRALAAGGGSLLFLTLQAATPAWADIPIANNPLFLINAKANVLVILDNSNSMDENAAGAAVGSANATSKSEIARGVVRGLTTPYQGRINMGLMAYRQPATASRHVHNSPYDLSYDPAHFNPAWTGDRASATNKRFRIPNPTSAGNHLHYNVALPFYSSSNMGNGFCYSTTANAFNNGENPGTGPWDSYRCFTSKTGASNTLPTWGDAASETASGFTSLMGTYTFMPTDSDFAQGILDFGRFLGWQWASTAWYANSSPGRGFLHVPIGDLNSTKATEILDRLRCNIPGTPAGCATTGIQNAGLTPIEGTLNTARDYFRGTWNVAAEGYTAACYPLPNSCGKNFVVLLTDGLPSTDRTGALVTNPSVGIAAAASAAAELKADNVETYVIGFALPYGTDPNSLNAVAAAGGTGTAYNASDTASLNAAFTAIFDDILRKTSAFGATSQNTTSINDGSRVYQARFDSTDWTGELLAARPNSDGTFTQIWNSSESGKIPTHGSRKVFSLNAGSGAGVEFKTYASLPSSQQTALNASACGGTLTTDALCGQARIDWLRGDQSQTLPTGPLRLRSKPIGDIISSPPFYVRDTQTVYVGSNGGMLHAFDAANGNELFAYVPNAVVGELHKLTAPNYSHRYYVDGEITVSDKARTPGGKNILVGALGRGGRALFALDVTHPASFSASNVMWEFTDADLGVVIGKPVLAKLNNGKFAVIVGNGPNSPTDRGFLFIIDGETGALIAKFDTKAGNTTTAMNGVVGVRGWDRDANGTVDWIYAGDLLGNVWKWDLSGSTVASWKFAFGTASTPESLFTATDGGGNPQPIMGTPGLGLNAKSGDPHFGSLYVFVGSGRYLTPSDVSSTAVQTWYGLIEGATRITGRDTLRQRTILAETTAGSLSVRAFSEITAGDMTGRRGWYIDMTNVANTPTGERFIGEQKYVGAALYATSIIPSANICTPGGDSYLNAIDPFSGGALETPYLDLNADAKYNDSDKITVGGKKVSAGSIRYSGALSSDGILFDGQVVQSNTDGNLSSRQVRRTMRQGRIAWREIVR